MSEYLSTDPNFGLDDGYLSTDPNFGLEKPKKRSIASDVYEVGRQVGAGAVVDLPKIAGQSIQAFTPKGSTISEYGKEMAKNAEARAPGWEPDLAGRGEVAEAFIKGGRSVAPSVAPLLLYAAGPVAGTIGTAALYGGSQYTEEYDKMKAAGASDEDARNAGLITGGIQGGGEAIANRLTLGLFGAGKKVAAEGIKGLVGQTVDKSVIKPFAKATGAALIGEPATEIAQDIGTAAVERQYGLPTQGYGNIAYDSGTTALAMTALLAPFGLAGHYKNSKRAEAIDKTLSDPEVGKMQRVGVVNGLYSEAKKLNIPDADAWHTGAMEDIANGLPVRRTPEAHPAQAQELQSAPNIAAGFSPEEVAAFQAEQSANQERMQRDLDIQRGMGEVNAGNDILPVEDVTLNPVDEPALYDVGYGEDLNAQALPSEIARQQFINNIEPPSYLEWAQSVDLADLIDSMPMKTSGQALTIQGILNGPFSTPVKEQAAARLWSLGQEARIPTPESLPANAGPLAKAAAAGTTTGAVQLNNWGMAVTASVAGEPIQAGEKSNFANTLKGLQNAQGQRAITQQLPESNQGGRDNQAGSGITVSGRVGQPGKPAAEAPGGREQPILPMGNATVADVPGVTFEQELIETRNPPEVAQPISVSTTRFVTKTLSGEKNITAKLYELPGYVGPQLAVAKYKSPRGQGYRVYLPKSGTMLADNNGVGELEDTLRMAVQRVSNAKAKVSQNKTTPATPLPASAPAPVTQQPSSLPMESAARTLNEYGRATDGKPINPGDVFRTLSGRNATPYPKQKGQKYASQWLIDNATAEAESRGDDFNARTFKNSKPLKDGTLTDADREGMLMYLFSQQPDVVPSILKPLTGEAIAPKPSQPAQKESQAQGTEGKTEGVAKKPDNMVRQSDVVLVQQKTNASAQAIGSSDGFTKFDDDALDGKYYLPKSADVISFSNGAWSTLDGKTGKYKAGNVDSIIAAINSVEGNESVQVTQPASTKNDEVSAFDQRYPNIKAAEKAIKARGLKDVSVFKDGAGFRIGARGDKKQAPSTNLIQRIKQLGGIHTRYRADVIGDKAGAPGLFSNTGKGLDDLATALQAEGFAIDTAEAGGGVDALTGLIQRAVNSGETVLNYAGQQAAAEKKIADDFRDNLKEEIAKLGGNPARNASTQKLVEMLNSLRAQLRADLEQESIAKAAQLEAIIGKELTGAEWDMLLDERNAQAFDYTQDIAAIARMEQEREAANAVEREYEGEGAQAAGQRAGEGPRQGDSTGGGEPQAARTEAGQEDFGLTGETPEEIRAREEAQAAKEKAEADRAKADEQPFVMTGSNRAADELAARGQQDIFSQPVNPKATRSKPKTRIAFDGITGPTGAKLTGYEWAWKPYAYVDRLGEDREGRESDWDNAETNVETGRDIVHKFTVAQAGNEQTVSLETALQLLGFAEAGSLSVKSVANTAKRVAKIKMAIAELEPVADAYDKAKAEVDAMPYPPITVEGIWARMGDAMVRRRSDDAFYVAGEKKTLELSWKEKRMAERGFKGIQSPHDVIADLKAKLERAERKMAEAVKAAANAPVPAQKAPDSSETPSDQLAAKSITRNGDNIVVIGYPREALENARTKLHANAIIDKKGQAVFRAGTDYTALQEALNPGSAYIPDAKSLKAEDFPMYVSGGKFSNARAHNFAKKFGAKSFDNKPEAESYAEALTRGEGGNWKAKKHLGKWRAVKEGVQYAQDQTKAQVPQTQAEQSQGVHGNKKQSTVMGEGKAQVVPAVPASDREKSYDKVEEKTKIQDNAPDEVRKGHAGVSTSDVAVHAQKAPDSAESDYKDRIHTLDVHEDLFKRVTAGTVTADEFKASFEALVKNKDAIVTALSAMTKDAIFKRFPILSFRYKSDKKAEVVDAAFRDMASDFVLGQGFSYGMGRDSFIDGIRAVVKRTTDQDLVDHAAALSKARAERAVRRDQAASGMADPQTLEDFGRLMNAKAQEMGDGTTYQQVRMTLTPEQRARFDELAGEKTRAERKARADQQKTTVSAPSEAVGASEIIKTKHTKHGHDLWQFTLERRVPPDEFKTLVAQAKRMGGDYSSYRGNGAIPGWQFRSEDAAIAFRKLVAGDTTAAQEVMQARRDAFQDDKSQSAVERLNEMAERLEDQAAEALGRDRKANTARRARFAASAEAAANSDKALAKTMRNIAQAIADGKAKFLDRVRQKAQVEMLRGFVRTAKDDEIRQKYPAYSDYEKHRGEKPTGETADYAKFPTYTAFRSDLASLGRQLEQVDGSKKLGAALLKVADDVTSAYLKFAKENLHKVSTFTRAESAPAVFASKETAEEAIKRSGFKGKAIALPFKRGQNIIIMSPSAAKEAGIWQGDEDKRITINAEAGAEIVDKVKAMGRMNRISMPWSFESTYDARKRLAGIGIETPAEFRSALREFIALQEQPAAPDKIKEMERAMIGRRNDGLDFFPTPASVAQEMIDAAELEEGMTVLEPSAGMAHIAERIREAGVEPDVVEMSGERRELLTEKGFNLVGSDFMDVTGEYDRIIMNPPFSNRRDIEHVRHAYKLLKPGGRLVAIMGEGSFFGSDKKATEFRDWLDSLNGTSEKLDEGTFMDPTLPVNTGANARLVVVDKPEGESPKFSRRPSFFSPLSKAIAQAKQDTMPAPQWRLWLNGNKAKLGLKDDEIQFSGINEYLELRGKDKVTKGEIADYLTGNGVRVEDVVKGQSWRVTLTGDNVEKFSSKQEAKERIKAENKWVDDESMSVDSDEDAGYIRVNDFDGNQYAIIDKNEDGEWIMTETSYPLDDDQQETFDDFDAAIERADEIAEEQRGYWRDQISSEPEETETATSAKFSGYWESSYKGGIPGTYREILVTLPGPVREITQSTSRQQAIADVARELRETGLNFTDAQNLASRALDGDADAIEEVENSGVNLPVVDVGEKPRFRSPHWDEPNVLVHIRLDEVTGADGKRYVRVGEIQSDWGQKGKKVGFGLPDKGGERYPNRPFGPRTPIIPSTPFAPFVTDTKSWVALGLKRAIIHGAEVGADGIVFGTGQQNADLYDLSKQVDSVVVKKLYGGKGWTVEAMRGGESVIDKQVDSEQELADTIGKDLAEKAVTEGGGEYSGLDLKVGGEGMRKFYDSIVPSVANEVLRKVGIGGKVVSVDTEGGKQPGFSITQEVRENLTEQGLPLFARTNDATQSVPYTYTKASPEDQAAIDKLNSTLQRYFGNDKHGLVPFSGRDTDVSRAFSEEIRSLFKTRVIFVQPKSGSGLFNGFQISGLDAIFVDGTSDAGFIQIAGHELWHHIETTRPDLAKWYGEQAKLYIKDLPAYRNRLNSLLQQGEEAYTDAGAESELLADFLGDSLSDPDFLQRLASSNESKFKRLITSVRMWLGNLAYKMRGLKSSRHIGDVRALQTYLAKVLDAYAAGKNIGGIATPNLDAMRDADVRMSRIGDTMPMPDIRFSRSGQSSGRMGDLRKKFGKPSGESSSKYAELNRRIREEHITAWDKAGKWLKRQFMPGGLLPGEVFQQKIKRDSEFEAIEFDIGHLVGAVERAIKADYKLPADKLDEKTQMLLSSVMAGEIGKDVPEGTKVALLGMRKYIDGLTIEYLNVLDQQRAELEAIGSAEANERASLMGVIAGNVGRYVHRSYKAFDDADWAKKVPDNVLDNAREYLLTRLTESGQAEPAKRVEVILNEILKHGTAYENMEAFIKESKLGAKDLSVLKKRQDISPEIRALLGEYTDPRINFAKSATKMGRLIWNQKFLDRIREIGMGSFLFTDETKPPEATVQIAGEGSDVYAPLNGLWTTPEVNQAFKDALGKEKMEDWYRTVVRINGAVKWGKTVGSPTTAARNWLSAFFFTVANGHFDMSQMRKSVAGFAEYFGHRSDAEKMAYLRELKQLGVVYDTPYAGEMMRLLSDSGVADKLMYSKGKMGVKHALDYANKFYQYGDDFWKIIGFENEKNMLIGIGMSEADAKVKAAERIRDTYPTYSMVGRGVQQLRRFPLAGSFVSFPAEIIRTSINMVRYLAEDYKNPKTRPLAKRRAAGLAIVSGFAYAAQAISMAMLGYDDDDEEAVRLMSAPWQRNSNLLFLGRDDNGNIKYMDLSFLDPYNYWKRPIVAVTRGQPWRDAIKDVAEETTKPFLGVDIAAGAIFEVLANKKDTGSPVYKEHDTITGQVVDIGDHLRKTLQPGLFNNMERTYKAMAGETTQTGKQYDLGDEVAAWVGFRASTLDPKVALYYRGFDFKDAKQQAEKHVRDVLKDQDEPSESDIQSAFELTVDLRERAYGDMAKLVNAAKESGMPPAKIAGALRNSGVSGADIIALMNGKTPKFRMSPQSLSNLAGAAANTFGPEARKGVYDRYRTIQTMAQ